MAAAKHSPHRRAFRTTRSLLRTWARRSSGPPSIKIFTNVQTASVAGINRVMSSFVEHAQASTRARVEMVCASLASPEQQRGGEHWSRHTSPANRMTTLLYHGPLPTFAEALESARGIRDMRRAFLPLIDAFAEELERAGPDIVLINGTFYVPWCLMLAAQRLELPVVVHYHGSLTRETEHWENKKKLRILSHIEADFYRGHNRYIFPSRLVKAHIEEEVFHQKLPKQRALVIPNPIPEEFFSTKPWRHKSGVAFVGRWTRIKNLSFTKRFVEASEDYPDLGPIYVVTDEQSRRKAVRVLHDRVRFVGPFSRPQTIAAFYGRRKAVLCPSYFETYGNVAQEAVASGTAALVSRNMGVAEIFQEVGLSRLIVDFNDLRAVVKLLRDARKLRIRAWEQVALQRRAGARVIHEELLQFLRYVQLHTSSRAGRR